MPITIKGIQENLQYNQEQKESSMISFPYFVPSPYDYKLRFIKEIYKRELLFNKIYISFSVQLDGGRRG